MKPVWIVLALLGALGCGVLGYLIINKPPTRQKSRVVKAGEDVPEDMIGELQKVDPKLIICRESARLATGLKELRGIGIGPEDKVYAVGDKSLAILSIDGTPLVKVDVGQTPECVRVDTDGTAYVGFREHVEVFDAAGARKAVWETHGPKSWVTAVAVAKDQVYVADFGEKRVYRYDKSGKRLGHIGPKETAARGRYEIPSPFFDVIVDAAGKPWLTHTGRRLIQQVQDDGTVDSAWGISSPQVDGFSGCCNPTHIALRKDGTFVTAEKGLVRVKIHKPDGGLVGVVVAAKDFAKDVRGLDLAVDSKDRILVADPGTSSVRVFVLN